MYQPPPFFFIRKEDHLDFRDSKAPLAKFSKCEEAKPSQTYTTQHTARVNIIFIWIIVLIISIGMFISYRSIYHVKHGELAYVAETGQYVKYPGSILNIGKSIKTFELHKTVKFNKNTIRLNDNNMLSYILIVNFEIKDNNMLISDFIKRWHSQEALELSLESKLSADILTRFSNYSMIDIVTYPTLLHPENILRNLNTITSDQNNILRYVKILSVDILPIFEDYQLEQIKQIKDLIKKSSTAYLDSTLISHKEELKKYNTIIKESNSILKERTHEH